MSFSVRRPLPERRLKMPVSFSVRLSNIGGWHAPVVWVGGIVGGWQFLTLHYRYGYPTSILSWVSPTRDRGSTGGNTGRSACCSIS